MDNTQEFVQQLIEEVGGLTETAKLFGITPGAVFFWKRDGSMPKARYYELKVRHPELKVFRRTWDFEFE